MGPPGCNDREMKRYKSKAKGAGKATGRLARVVGCLPCGDSIVMIFILYLGAVQSFTARHLSLSIWVGH